MSVRRLYKPLQDFLSSLADFRVIYNSSGSQFITPNTSRIFILDSSFNPPHLGHYALIKESLSGKYFTHDEKPDERVILLLLSVNNADKQHAPESFENRLEMMYLMAQDLSKKYPQTHNISIGLTKHAKFVDKSVSILRSLDVSAIRLTFLVGYDTLIRIFNPKYYLPDKISSSLEDFMTSTDLFCLTRNDGELHHSEQSSYLENIRSGKNEHIPTHWSNNIFLHENFGDEVGMISSSKVRHSIQNGGDWKDHLIPEVSDLIVQDKLYQSS
ncbi:Nucleotidylyl transferase [Suhomyces tanzawaensis NRRL Y-17324]|uniref:Nucleotidylyl transferase n=1 Tax=Suhomyces tanzawaensis NRRL Y-17324 TaxID=984487 RepID=A0A1E4SEU4_9ASCO|nr:Nucleotidylyl transferase [Suhomyces tanzawaensis NRRL Y-17324]ODV77986.1 Nucleotidylyl transferase [Suhomyces tanzawaensis NRRL Y-17324]